MTKDWIWFMLSAFTAAIMVGLSSQTVAWGLSTLLVLFALRNAVMSGYVEVRGRYESDPVLKGVRDAYNAERPR